MVTCEGFMVFFLAVPTVSPTQSTSEIFIKKRVVTLLFPGEEVGKENDQILVTTRACYNQLCYYCQCKVEKWTEWSEWSRTDLSNRR